MKIAVIGLGESHREAPWETPDWQRWGMVWDGHWPWCDALFEMHAEMPDRFTLQGRHLWERMEAFDGPVFLHAAHSALPNSEAYPISAVIDSVGDYFVSSISYMLALAIHKKPERIGLWGVDLREENHHQQRPGIEYLLGVAYGRGIPVEIHGPSDLFTRADMLEMEGYPHRYGIKDGDIELRRA